MKQYLLSLMLVFIMSSSLGAQGIFSFSSALVGMSMDYREYDDSKVILDSEKSSFSKVKGTELILDYTLIDNNYNYTQYGIETFFLGGVTDYVGAYIGDDDCDTYGCLTDSTLNAVFDVAAYYMHTDTFTFNHGFNHGFDIGYGMALGYRSWERALSANQIEVYYWYSVRPRVKFTYRYSVLSVGALAEYQYGINPRMSCTGFPTDFFLGSANIVKLKIPIRYDLDNRTSFFVEYVYEEQVIEKSNVQANFLEPDSTANNEYAKIGVVFKF